MFTDAAVRATVYLHRLGIAILLFAFCPDMQQFPPIVADVIILILKNGACHVVILPDVFFVFPNLPFFIILKFDIAPNLILFQIQQILFTAITTVCGNRLQDIHKCALMFFRTGISVL